MTILTNKNRKTNIAYENIRLQPNTQLSQELSAGYREDYIAEEGKNEHNADTVSPASSDISNIHVNQTENNVSRALLTGAVINRNQTKKIQNLNAVLTLARQEIGQAASRMNHMDKISGVTLRFQKQRALELLRESIGKRQISATELEHAPQWLLDDATLKSKRIGRMHMYKCQHLPSIRMQMS